MPSLPNHVIERGLYYALLAAFLIYALSQARKPGKWGGWFFVWVMNLSHSKLTDWGLTHVQVEENFTILMWVAAAAEPSRSWPRLLPRVLSAVSITPRAAWPHPEQRMPN